MPATATQRKPTRRQGVLRVRTGCLTCRSRKKKCDEVRPACAGCKRNALECRWPTDRRDTGQARSASILQSISRAADTEEIHCVGVNSSSSPTEPIRSDGIEPVMSNVFHQLEENLLEPMFEGDYVPNHHHSTHGNTFPSVVYLNLGSPHVSAITTLGEDKVGEEALLDSNFQEKCPGAIIAGHPPSSPITSDSSPRHALVVSRSPSLLPGLNDQSFELMSYYLSRTASSMGNGSTAVNPFTVQLIPLSFASDVVLQLILSQSAVHRAITDEESDSKSLAQHYYTKSVHLVRHAINEYITGKEVNPLWVAVGTLIMCFTETAKGDTRGLVFDHLLAAGPLLVDLVSKFANAIDHGLKAFMVEYYIYTSTLSMISIDSTVGALPFMNTDLQTEAQRLVDASYMGQLCGCWLEILLLIPRIHEFGRRSRAPTVEPVFPVTDDFINFADLQSQILCFHPDSSVPYEVAICGYVFQQAAYLYLVTAHSRNEHMSGTHKSLTERVIEKAFSYLRQLSPNARIGTSLCWPLAVIGSCTTTKTQQSELRERMKIMFETIGLGNINSTMMLLQHIWALPIHESERSPWIISRVMQEHQIWMSFA